MKIQKIIIAVLVVAVIFGGFYIYSLKKEVQEKSSVTTKTSTVTVTKGVLAESIRVTGKAELANEQKLRF